MAGLFSLLQRLRVMYKALNQEPLAKTINPMIGWQALIPHAEAMTTLCINVQFDWMTSSPPRTIQGHAWIHSHLIITGKSDEEWRCIGWDNNIFPKRTLDRS